MTDSWKSDLLVFLKSVADDACCLTGVNEAKPKKSIAVAIRRAGDEV